MAIAVYRKGEEDSGAEVVSFFISLNSDTVLLHYSIIPINQKIGSLEVFVKDFYFDRR